MKGCCLISTLVALALASPVWAQTAGIDEHDGSGLKRIEVGAELSGFYLGGGKLLAGVRVRVNLSRRFAVQTTGDIHLGGGDQPWQVSSPLSGPYSVEVHQSLEPRGRVTPFVTYGATGWFEYERVSEFRVPYGSGDTLVFPASSRLRVVPPLVPTAGGGVRLTLSRAVVLEAGARTYVLPPYAYGVAGHVGIMVPIGRRRSS